MGLKKMILFADFLNKGNFDFWENRLEKIQREIWKETLELLKKTLDFLNFWTAPLLKKWKSLFKIIIKIWIILFLKFIFPADQNENCENFDTFTNSSLRIIVWNLQIMLLTKIRIKLN